MKNTSLQKLNILILLAKQYIYLSKNNKELILKSTFYRMLYIRFESKTYLARIKNNNVMIRTCENILSFVDNRLKGTYIY